MKEIAIAGLTTIASNFGVTQTVDRIESAIRTKGLTILSLIDHAAAAKDVGLALRPTVLIIFGNARGGTPLMQAAQTIGIDLPLKILVWEDTAGKTWVSYNEPGWLARRHEVSGMDEVAAKLSALIDAIAREAANQPNK